MATIELNDQQHDDLIEALSDAVRFAAFAWDEDEEHGITAHEFEQYKTRVFILLVALDGVEYHLSTVASRSLLDEQMRLFRALGWTGTFTPDDDMEE